MINNKSFGRSCVTVRKTNKYIYKLAQQPKLTVQNNNSKRKPRGKHPEAPDEQLNNWLDNEALSYPGSDLWTSHSASAVVAINRNPIRCPRQPLNWRSLIKRSFGVLFTTGSTPKSTALRFRGGKGKVLIALEIKKICGYRCHRRYTAKNNTYHLSFFKYNR